MKKIFLSNGQVSLVDGEDFLYLSGYNWGVSGRGYVRCTNNISDRCMHRIVAKKMGLNLSNEIDHIDGDKLNNQRENLRSATRKQNMANSVLNILNTSGYKGVTKRKNKWEANIQINDQTIYLGLFDTPEEAHQAYCAAAEEHFGEFANP